MQALLYLPCGYLLLDVLAGNDTLPNTMPFSHPKKAADAGQGNFRKPLRRWRIFHAFTFGGLGIQLAIYLTVTFPDSAPAGNGPAMSTASVPKTKSELDQVYGVGSW